MAQRTLADDLRDMSGEELVVLAAMSNAKMKKAIEAELARRSAAATKSRKRAKAAAVTVKSRARLVA